MAESSKQLEDLKLYIGVNLTLMDVSTRLTVEGILERTVEASKAGATKEQINEIFRNYVSAWQPDKTYG